MAALLPRGNDGRRQLDASVNEATRGGGAGMAPQVRAQAPAVAGPPGAPADSSVALWRWIPDDQLPDSPLSLWLDQYGDYTQSPRSKGAHRRRGRDRRRLHRLCHRLRAEAAHPALDVALVEARTAGYGASGRNGSFAMTVVGLGFGTTAMLRGKKFLTKAHTYMMSAVDELEAFIDREKLDCDKIRPGFLRVATPTATSSACRSRSR